MPRSRDSTPHGENGQSTPKDRFDRLPPYDELAERAVLGGILLFNDYIAEAADIVQPEHFHQHAHQLMFRAILKLREKNRGVDLVTLAEALNRTKQLGEIGGLAYLEEVAGSVPHAAHTRHYAGIVREKWQQRQLIGVCNDILQESYEQGTDTNELIEKATAKVVALAETGQSTEDTEMPALMLAHQDELLRRINRESSGISSGFQSVDNVTQGFQPGTVTVIAARPGVGKTALLCNFLRQMAEARPLFFSLEQPKLQIADRLLSISAGIGLKAIRKGYVLTDDERDRLLQAAGVLSESGMFISDRPSRTVSQLASMARIHKRKKNIGIILIDYLQLIRADNPRAPDHEQVQQISRDIAALAKELAVPILCLAQMNREVDKRSPKDRKPRLADLRGSGSIEQDAFAIAFLDVPSMYDDDADPTKAQLIFAKNRDGETGVVELVWDRDKVTFTDPQYDFGRAYGGFMANGDGWDQLRGEQPMQGGFGSGLGEMNYGQGTL